MFRCGRVRPESPTRKSDPKVRPESPTRKSEPMRRVRTHTKNPDRYVLLLVSYTETKCYSIKEKGHMANGRKSGQPVARTMEFEGGKHLITKSVPPPRVHRDRRCRMAGTAPARSRRRGGGSGRRTGRRSGR